MGIKMPPKKLQKLQRMESQPLETFDDYDTNEKKVDESRIHYKKWQSIIEAFRWCERHSKKGHVGETRLLCSLDFMVNGESVTIEVPIVEPYTTSTTAAKSFVTKDMANELVSACAAGHIDEFNDKYAELKIFIDEERKRIQDAIEEDNMRSEVARK